MDVSAMWKLTTDELPPEGVKVLAHYPDDDTGFDAYLDILMRNGACWFDQEGGEVGTPPHWMTIPEPPTS